MRILLDEGAPLSLARELPNCDVSHVTGIKNGELLNLIERASFDGFITNDKRMNFQQRLAGRPFWILVLSTNDWPTVRQHIAEIVKAIDLAKPGMVVNIDCGQFVPQKFRNREDR